METSISGGWWLWGFTTTEVLWSGRSASSHPCSDGSGKPMWRANHVHLQKSGADLESLSPEYLPAWSLVVDLLWYWKNTGKETNSSPEIFESWTNFSMSLSEMLETALEIWNKSLKESGFGSWKTGNCSKYCRFQKRLCVELPNNQARGHGPWLWLALNLS